MYAFKLCLVASSSVPWYGMWGYKVFINYTVVCVMSLIGAGTTNSNDRKIVNLGMVCLCFLSEYFTQPLRRYCKVAKVALKLFLYNIGVVWNYHLCIFHNCFNILYKCIHATQM